MLNKPGKFFMQPMKVCLPWWTATDATHNCMPGCESILAVTESWLICVCRFCLCGIRSWKYGGLRMKELLNLLQKCWVGKQDQSVDMGCHVSLPYWTVSSEIMSLNRFVFDHLAFCWWKDTLKLNLYFGQDCTQHRVVIPFQLFGITNWSHLQGSRCPRRTYLDSREPAHTGYQLRGADCYWSYMVVADYQERHNLV
jgi:hypothetical protein